MTKKLPLFVIMLVSLALVVCTGSAVFSAGKDKGKPAAPSDPAQGSSEQQPVPAPVNLNQAGAEELQKLPGVGPKIAEEIVKYREANGPFTAVEDLIKVKGIGAAKFQRIRQRVSVE